MDKKEKLFKRLRNMKQYKDYSDENLNVLIEKKIKDEELIGHFVGLSDEETQKALQLYDKYLSENSFESLAEKSSLINLVYKEILKERLQEFIKKESDEKKGAIPLHNVEKIMELDSQILEDKEKLGMLKNKEESSVMVLWNELMQKGLTFYKEHAGEIYYKCPYCNELSRQVMQIDGYDITKASFFKGTTLYNRPLMNLYHNKVITIEQASEILGVHQKYIIFIYEQI